jgi:hypothetical protein
MMNTKLVLACCLFALIVGGPWNVEAMAETSSAGSTWWSLREPGVVRIPIPSDFELVRNPVDSFILEKLKKEGLVPAEACSKRVLIRRATFDLTGLPPTPDEIESFLADNSADAYSKLVDRLLSSSHYGERWGRHWLDLVRYADLPNAYRYRDWVIDSFNCDMPYDKFVRYQLAGDQIPTDDGDDFNPAGIIATGLLAIGEWGIGEADKPKMMTNIVDDQIDVVGRVFMGLTTSCARCHDHKYDPITSEDYYALAGIFFSTHIIPEPGSQTHGSKRLQVPLLPQEELDKIHYHQERLAQLEEQIGAITKQAYRDYVARSMGTAGQYLLAAGQYLIRAADQPDISLVAWAEQQGLKPFALKHWLDYLNYRPFRHAVRDIQVDRPFGHRGVHAWMASPNNGEKVFTTAWVGVNSNNIPVGICIEDDRGNTVSNIILWAETVAAFPPEDGAVVIGWKSPVVGKVALYGRIRDADVVSGDGVEWRIVHRRGDTRHTLASGDLPNGSDRKFEVGEVEDKSSLIPVDAGDMLCLELHSKENNLCDISLVDWVISDQKGSQVWDLAKDTVADLHETGTGQGNPHADRLGNSDVWYFFDNLESPALVRWHQTVREVALGKLDRSVLEQVAMDYQDRLSRAATEEYDIDENSLRNVFFQLHNEIVSDHGPFWLNARIDLDVLPAEYRDHLAQLRCERDKLKQQPVEKIPYAVASLEGGVPNSPYEGVGDARIHIRGGYDQLGDKVPRGMLRALLSPRQKPILAGSGRLELADWLVSPDHPLTARVMVNRVWQNHFGAGIVRTPNNFGMTGDRPSHPKLLDFLAGYFVKSRWSIKAMHRLIMLSTTYQQSSSTLHPHDPENRLFGRMNRQRLEAESIRDSILAVSGNLDRSMGAKAYTDFMKPRRTLYLSIARSGGVVFNRLFDVPDPSTIAAERDVSTVAPQSLFVLNHPFFVRQARLLAQRITTDEKDGNDVAKIQHVYHLLYGRPPQPEELQIAVSLLSSSSSSVSAEIEEGALTWEEYCHILLASNEFIYID